MAWRCTMVIIITGNDDDHSEAENDDDDNMMMIRFGRRKLYIPACVASSLSIGLVRSCTGFSTSTGTDLLVHPCTGNGPCTGTGTCILCPRLLVYPLDWPCAIPHRQSDPHSFNCQ